MLIKKYIYSRWFDCKPCSDRSEHVTTETFPKLETSLQRRRPRREMSSSSSSSSTSGPTVEIKLSRSSRLYRPSVRSSASSSSPPRTNGVLAGAVDCDDSTRWGDRRRVTWQEPIEGKIVVKSDSSISHYGVRLSVNGSVNMQVWASPSPRVRFMSSLFCVNSCCDDVALLRDL